MRRHIAWWLLGLFTAGLAWGFLLGEHQAAKALRNPPPTIAVAFADTLPARIGTQIPVTPPEAMPPAQSAADSMPDAGSTQTLPYTVTLAAQYGAATLPASPDTASAQPPAGHHVLLGTSDNLQEALAVAVRAQSLGYAVSLSNEGPLYQVAVAAELDPAAAEHLAHTLREAGFAAQVIR